MSSQLVWLAMTKLCDPNGAPSTRTLTPQIRVAAARNRLGQGDRPNSHFEAMWIGAQARNSATSPAMRSQRIGMEGGRSALAVNGDAV